MRRKSTILLISILLTFLICICSLPAVAGDPQVDSLHQKTNSEIIQEQAVKVLDLQNEHLKFIIQGLAAVIFVLMTTQIVVTYIQLRREKRQDERQAFRDEKHDLAELSGVKQVSEIMTVVHQTLEGRRIAEEEARTKAKEAEERYEKVVNTFEQFYRGFKTKVEDTQKILEEKASSWASDWKRHEFRDKTDKLNEFARDFEQYKTESKLLQEALRPFSARVPYIRGIGAHYANQPEITRQYLSEVVGFQQPEEGEDEISYKRRVANAYYYLGLTEANFGNDDQAINYFEKANNLDMQHRDFLTKVVIAEAYAMNGNFEKANSSIAEIEKAIGEMENNEGELANYHLRLRNRARLIRANIEIRKNGGKWGETVKQIINPIYVSDPKYYYATATLAQAYAASDDYEDSARKLFQEVYETIISTGHLLTVKEVRSRILLLMFAGMSARHGLLQNQRIFNDYLDEADKLRSNLPKIGDKSCTVFSPLSKRNEDSETIFYHINLIKNGTIFLT